MKSNILREHTLGVVAGFLIVAFLFVGCAAARPAGTEVYKGREVAPNEVLVKFRGTAAPQVIGQAVTGENVDEAEYVGSTHVLRLHSRGKNVATLISELSARGDVEYAEPNYIVHAMDTSPNDPLYGQLWGMSAIGAPMAWDISTGSAANVVAVVDTGIDYTHPDLAARVWSAPSDFTVTISGRTITCPAGTHGFNAITNSCDPMDDNSHGTHVSGTIGAAGNNGVGVAGVNWNANLMGSKFLDSTGSGYLSNAINAIEFAIQAKARFGSAANVRVLSNSWGGGGFSQALLDEINKANASDMLFVAAAGNAASNNDLTPSYPSNYNAPNVVAVAATDSTDSPASFSNYGATTVDLGAPGVSILSTTRGGSYASYNGTSMATPHVSGAAALILSRCALSTADLKTDILGSVDSVLSLKGKTVTGGRLNVNKALLACSAPPAPDFSLSASPGSLPVAQGTSGTSAITVSALNGFVGAVGLTVTGTPSGASATLSSTPVTPPGTSTLTVNGGTAAPGTYTLTITGTSGSFTHTTTVAVTITAPDFSLSASPSSRTVNRGSSTTYTVTITRKSGFTGQVGFTVAGLPSGASGTFSPNPATGTSSALSVTTKSTTPTGTFRLTITGSSGSLSRTASVTLQVRRNNGIFSRATGQGVDTTPDES